MLTALLRCYKLYVLLIIFLFLLKNDSGYDYLSVEEKECLMFLEETLDSLDTGADSGVCPDETEAAESSKHPRTWPTRDVPKGKFVITDGGKIVKAKSITSSLR